MKIFYVILEIIILVLIFLYFKKRINIKKNLVSNQNSTKLGPKAIKFDSNLDLPVEFGYKCQWFAVKTNDTQAVLEAMKLKNIQITNWRTGIEGAYEGYYFISPPINGWTLVINSIMPDLSGTESPNPLTVISDLSLSFGEAYYFGTHRVVEYHAWAKSINGKLVRAYGYLGETGETIINQGEISKEELENNLIFTDLDVEEPNLPDEEDVLFIAKKWTVDPQMENDNYQTGTGFIGIID
ncbi:hypothetical protein [Paenibacillus sp. Soil522]|uniref:hypothetical protein n=1 Tax=Paenibacillus sp. Soil522 TaxID=1736388 RepID=UPI0006FAC1C0|nr:hypothetical protein [Paenibacillus sp. Soil522]KRE36788.1 hypothetical protein ASG81_20370 [Paenibacillus sp. Soil522]